MNKETSAKGKWDGPLDESGNPVLEGHGTFVWENGDKYSGQWKKDSFTGQANFFISTETNTRESGKMACIMATEPCPLPVALNTLVSGKLESLTDRER